jgi:histidinol phosphatase-like enzyme
MEKRVDKCYFIDVDGVLIVQGTFTPIPGAIEKCNEYFDAGHQVWLFTCWPTTPESANKLRSLGIKFHGMLPKPLAKEYVYIDDRLVPEECRKAMI